MGSLTYLADLCSKIDKTYHVSLEYGAHIGDVPRWCMRVEIPRRAIFLNYDLVRGDDIGANLNAAFVLGEDLKRAASWAFCEEPHAHSHDTAQPA